MAVQEAKSAIEDATEKPPTSEAAAATAEAVGGIVEGVAATLMGT